LASPELADKAQALGAFCRYGTSLGPRLTELAILITGAHWRAGFEWVVHAPFALRAGLDAADVDALNVGSEPAFSKKDERAVYRFASELLVMRRVSDTTFRFAHETLGQCAIVDLVGVLGYYGLISMAINAFEVACPEGTADPFLAGESRQC
jgi:4-carboxymuconolactone decarboxylase